MTIDPNMMLVLLAVLGGYLRIEHRFTKLETAMDLLHPELHLRKHRK